MTTTSNLISVLAKSKQFKVQISYIAPVLHIILSGEVFADLEYEARIDKVTNFLVSEGIEVDALNTLLRAAPISLDCISVAEGGPLNAMKAATESSSFSSWIPWFNNSELPEQQKEPLQDTKFVHFYGYKGGQGRSTVLALLAKSLASDGFKVLAIDADVEAPSLDYLFGGRADDHSQTLMGLCGWAQNVKPIVGVHLGTRDGRVDLLACRSRQAEIDLDFALFVSTNPLDTRVLENGAEKLLQFLRNSSEKYDAVLIDHRTGMAASVLPLVRKLPGAAAIFARPDSNVVAIPSDLLKIIQSILRSGVPSRSFFVNFSLDSNRAKDSPASQAEAIWREALSKELETASRSKDTPDDDELIYSPAELSYRWVDWFLDRALLGSEVPDLSRLQIDNIDALGKMRELVDLSATKRITQRAPAVFNTQAKLSVSGARDHGLFIQIPEVERLLAQGNPYTYILGRKGTGKTRLLNELAERGLGKPLLVASDEVEAGGLQSGSVEATTWMDRCGRDPEVFWWSLLSMSIDDGVENEPITVTMSRHLRLRSDPYILADKLSVREKVAHHPKPLVFLIDGLETMVPAAESRELVAALFRLMATVQNDVAFSSKLTLRLFVREDLATGAVQNVEQQMDGRYIQIRWSAASILNFALSRLPNLPWISSRYAQVRDRIVSPSISERIAFGQLSEQECIDLLLDVLPDRIRRNNLSTKTFLKLYFSDAGGDETNRAAFYPRLYMSFLGKLDAFCADVQQPLNEEGKIDSRLVNQAYDWASSEFINETKLELVYLLSLQSSNSSDQDESDSAKVERFIGAFDGMSTPFEYEPAIRDLIQKTGFSEGSVRTSLIGMKRIRMFEDRPGYAGWWRVGQLFKMGLRMKYTR